MATSAERNEALAKRFTQVKTNGGAWLLAVTAQGEADAVALRMAADTDNFVDAMGAIPAVDMLRNGIMDVRRFAEPFRGADFNQPVSEASWNDLRGAIARLYGLWWNAEAALPPELHHTGWRAWAMIAVEVPKQVITGTIDFAGDVAKKAIEAAGGILNKAIDVGGDAAEGVIMKFLKATWPVLLAGAVVVGGGIYLVATGKVKVPEIKAST